MTHPLQSKRILITGGAGFIGSHLVDAMVGSTVRVLDDFSTGSRGNLSHHHPSHVEVIQGDIRDVDLVREITKEIDVVIHLACRGVRHSIGNPIESHDVNASGTLNLLQAAHRENVERFVHVSSSEVYGTAMWAPMDETHPCRPETVYGAAKLAGEAYARAFFRTYEMPVVIIRPFNNFGPRSHFEGDSGEVIPRFCAWALNDQAPVIFGDGSQTRDFIYVKDTARWIRKIASTEKAVGKTINLGTGNEVSVKELAELVYKLVGCQRPPRFCEERPGDVKRLVADASLAETLIGLRGKTSLKTGIKELITHMQSTHPISSELLDQMQDRNWVRNDAAAALAH